MKETYTNQEIENLKEQLEFRMLKRFGVNAGGLVVKMIRETFKEYLK